MVWDAKAVQHTVSAYRRARSVRPRIVGAQRAHQDVRVVVAFAQSVRAALLCGLAARVGVGALGVVGVFHAGGREAGDLVGHVGLDTGRMEDGGQIRLGALTFPALRLPRVPFALEALAADSLSVFSWRLSERYSSGNRRASRMGFWSSHRRRSPFLTCKYAQHPAYIQSQHYVQSPTAMYSTRDQPSHIMTPHIMTPSV